MTTQSPARKTPFLLIGLAGVALAICIFLPLAGKYRRFPYSGTWVKNIASRDGRVVQQAIVFTKDGRCFQSSGHGQRMQCTYVMQGSSAIVTHRLKHVPLSGKLLTITVHNKATPVWGGEVIYLQPFGGTMVDEQTGQVSPPTPADEAFKRRAAFRWKMLKVSEDG